VGLEPTRSCPHRILSRAGHSDRPRRTETNALHSSESEPPADGSSRAFSVGLVAPRCPRLNPPPAPQGRVDSAGRAFGWSVMSLQLLLVADRVSAGNRMRRCPGAQIALVVLGAVMIAAAAFWAWLALKLRRRAGPSDRVGLRVAWASVRECPLRRSRCEVSSGCWPLFRSDYRNSSMPRPSSCSHP
jgi:hypothetical protein